MRFVATRAAVVTAAIYGYFLIFAQFAFVELLRADLGTPGISTGGTPENVLMGLMALAGIMSGFWVAWKGGSSQKIRGGLILAGVASTLAPWASGFVGLAAIAVLTGIAIGVSTISLATRLRSWCGLLAIGLGTGAGYACCNLPFVFSQAPAHQAWIASAFAIVGAACVPRDTGSVAPASAPVFPFPAALLLFTALVWLDSAAFFIIQHSIDLKSGTWGQPLLWRNAVLHLTAAAAAGIWLKRGGARILPMAAWVILAVAALAVNQESSRMLAGWLYPIAVSLYSAALVAWPGWFSGTTGERAVGWRAAWLYGVAGWFGSANGIGMVQTLHRVPYEFIIIAGLCVIGVVVFSSVRNRRPALVIALIAAIGFWPRPNREQGSGSAYERGKQVYLSEGCIHCHSQYVRPGSRDEEYWGPAHPGMTASRPVLIGNRRQGPDLANIGARRSAPWLKQHFIDPQVFSPGSSMPSYKHLFEDGRGDDLIRYLQQCGGSEMAATASKSAVWKPTTKKASAGGQKLFATQCAMCHGPAGKADGIMAAKLTKPPANLVSGPFIWSAPSADQELKICRIIKFGIPGTDMPGHETLTDDQVRALEQYVVNLRH